MVGRGGEGEGAWLDGEESSPHTPTQAPAQGDKMKQTKLNFAPKEKSMNPKEEDQTSAETTLAVQQKQDTFVPAVAEFSSELSLDEDMVQPVEMEQKQPQKAP
eukprot:672494-Rhodomonas_salina.1